MYSLSDYWAMMADKGRMDPYVTALQSAVNNDSVVVDIGTGTGFFALLACKLGARHVYAIEPNDAVQVGRELAKANGFSERITFIQGLSSKITLPEKANVIISDMRGILPLCTHHLPSIIDARRRHLEHGGVLIPSRDSIRVALTEAPDLYQRYTLPYNDNDLGVDMQAAMRWVRNSLWIDKVGEEGNEQILGETKTWVTLDYHTLDNPNAMAKASPPKLGILPSCNLRSSGISMASTASASLIDNGVKNNVSIKATKPVNAISVISMDIALNYIRCYCFHGITYFLKHFILSRVRKLV